MEKAGYYVVIYSSKDWLVNKLNMSKLTKYDVWVAQWNSECTYEGNYGLWQYSDKGKVNGISGNVDLDYAFKDYPTIISRAGLNGFPKKVTPKPKEEKPQKPKKEKYYTVKKGDNLTKIAKKYKVTVSQLVAWNGIKNPDIIYVGQRLRVR